MSSSFDPSTGLTCVTCRLVFKEADVQREHYRTDWHRYNMKRQVAELPPVTDEQFREKVLTYRSEKEADRKEAEDTQQLYCTICRKQMKSRNAYENHVVSKKHKEMETSERKGPRQPRKKATNIPAAVNGDAAVVPTEDVEMESEDDDDSSSGWVTDDGEEEDWDFDEEKALPVTACLFCPQTKGTGAETQEHMRFHHGFMLPDRKYLTDEEGMMKYLGMKVGAGRCCIYCPDRKSRFGTIDACQMHMRDKEHCKIAKDPQSMLEFAEYYDYSPMYENENGETSDVLYDDGWTLTLPSGSKIGHRSLMQYYRQYLRPVDAVKRDAGRAAIDRARGILPALAWTGTSGVAAKQVARDLKFVDRYRRKFDLRWKSCSQKKAHRLFKTKGRVGDN